MPAGNSRRVCIRILMACAALQRRNALTRRPTHHVEEVSMTVVTLLGIIPGCVAVDTARMSQNAIDLFPGGKAFGS
jgi:hypothetical protein